MALRIRLRRMGRKKAPHYRIVVAESSSPRDGRFVELIGRYNPRTEPMTLVVDAEKARKWLSVGARPTETVDRLFNRAGVYNPPSAVETAAAAVTGGVAQAASAVGGVASQAVEAMGDVTTQAASVVGAAASRVADAVGGVLAQAVETVQDAAAAVAERVTGGDDEAPAASADEAAEPDDAAPEPEEKPASDQPASA